MTQEHDHLRIKTYSGKKPDGELMDYPMQRNSDLAGAGQPMDAGLLKEKIIESYREYQALKRKAQDTEIKEFLEQEPVAITLGKESLLTLLSQKGCEGIRFYFCKNPKTKGRSVAAVGVAEATEPAGFSTAQSPGGRKKPIRQDLYLTGEEGNFSQGRRPSFLEEESGTTTNIQQASAATNGHSAGRQSIRMLNFEVGPPDYYSFVHVDPASPTDPIPGPDESASDPPTPLDHDSLQPESEDENNLATTSEQNGNMDTPASSDGTSSPPESERGNASSSNPTETENVADPFLDSLRTGLKKTLGS